MNDLFALTSPNIYIARFFSKEPGPNSTFFKLSARHAFWDLNCYLKAQFSDTRKAGQTFDGLYHRTIFEDDCNNRLKLKNDPQSVKAFLRGPFRYYAKLFLKLRRLGEAPASIIPECYYLSSLNRMDGHIMLALAACGVDDQFEDEKLRAVAKAFDRAYVTLQLNRAYDSNQFQELLYTLQPTLRKCLSGEIEQYIDSAVIAEINIRRSTSVTVLLPYEQFRQVGYGDYNPTFLRYFLARIEVFITSGLGCGLQDTLYNYVRGVGKGNAYHIEHILAHNDESRELFKGEDGMVDEVMFENQRNRFGGLLLLKGQDNQSSGKENYSGKLKTYAGSAPYLAQTLVPDFYKSNSSMNAFLKSSNLPFVPAPQFNRGTLEHRSELVYAIVKQIWGV